MVDRFGVPGAFAAYHAGPARYAAHVRQGVSLPPETRRYVAQLSAAVDIEHEAVPATNPLFANSAVARTAYRGEAQSPDPRLLPRLLRDPPTQDRTNLAPRLTHCLSATPKANRTARKARKKRQIKPR